MISMHIEHILIILICISHIHNDFNQFGGHSSDIIMSVSLKH